MKKYKDVWIYDIGAGKFGVCTKAGTNYIARPPDALNEAVEKARAIRSGNKPIILLSVNKDLDRKEFV